MTTRSYPPLKKLADLAASWQGQTFLAALAVVLAASAAGLYRAAQIAQVTSTASARLYLDTTGSTPGFADSVTLYADSASPLAFVHTTLQFNPQQIRLVQDPDVSASPLKREITKTHSPEANQSGKITLTLGLNPENRHQAPTGKILLAKLKFSNQTGEPLSTTLAYDLAVSQLVNLSAQPLTLTADRKTLTLNQGTSNLQLTSFASPSASSPPSSSSTSPSPFASPPPTGGPTPTPTQAPFPSFAPLPATKDVNLPPVHADYVSNFFLDWLFHSRKRLKTDTFPHQIIYLTFDLGSLQNQEIIDAKFLAYIINPANPLSTQSLNLVRGPLPEKLTYADRPELGEVIGELNGGEADSWLSYDLTDLVRANLGGSLTFAISTKHQDGLHFSSPQGRQEPYLSIRVPE